MNIQVILPNGFRLIAENSDNRNKTVRAYYNPDRERLFFIIHTLRSEENWEELGLGPIASDQLQELCDCLKDVREMRGSYAFLDS